MAQSGGSDAVDSNPEVQIQTKVRFQCSFTHAKVYIGQQEPDTVLSPGCCSNHLFPPVMPGEGGALTASAQHGRIAAICDRGTWKEQWEYMSQKTSEPCLGANEQG